MRRLRAGDDAVDLAGAHSYPQDRPWLRANMVASVDFLRYLRQR